MPAERISMFQPPWRRADAELAREHSCSCSTEEKRRRWTKRESASTRRTNQQQDDDVPKLGKSLLAKAAAVISRPVAAARFRLMASRIRSVMALPSRRRKARRWKQDVKAVRRARAPPLSRLPPHTAVATASHSLTSSRKGTAGPVSSPLSLHDDCLPFVQRYLVAYREWSAEARSLEASFRLRPLSHGCPMAVAVAGLRKLSLHAYDTFAAYAHPPVIGTNYPSGGFQCWGGEGVVLQLQRVTRQDAAKKGSVPHSRRLVANPQACVGVKPSGHPCARPFASSATGSDAFASHVNPLAKALETSLGSTRCAALMFPEGMRERQTMTSYARIPRDTFARTGITAVEASAVRLAEVESDTRAYGLASVPLTEMSKSRPSHTTSRGQGKINTTIIEDPAIFGQVSEEEAEMVAPDTAGPTLRHATGTVAMSVAPHEAASQTPTALLTEPSGSSNSGEHVKQVGSGIRSASGTAKAEESQMSIRPAYSSRWSLPIKRSEASSAKGTLPLKPVKSTSDEGLAPGCRKAVPPSHVQGDAGESSSSFEATPPRARNDHLPAGPPALGGTLHKCVAEKETTPAKACPAQVTTRGPTDRAFPRSILKKSSGSAHRIRAQSHVRWTDLVEKDKMSAEQRARLAAKYLRWKKAGSALPERQRRNVGDSGLPDHGG